jgi:hypothetical protein
MSFLQGQFYFLDLIYELAAIAVKINVGIPIIDILAKFIVVDVVP